MKEDGLPSRGGDCIGGLTKQRWRLHRRAYQAEVAIVSVSTKSQETLTQFKQDCHL